MSKFVNSIPIERLIDKYRLSISSIYIIVNKAKGLFEGKRGGYRIL